MISIATHFNPERATDYFRSDLALPARLLHPSWLGNFARMLDLDGEIPKSAESLSVLNRLARGCSPSGVPLLAGVMRHPDRPRRSSYDVVVSAPKTVSVAALVADDHRIFDVHDQAVRIVFEEMQLRARISYRGLRRKTNALVAAHFVHTDSREKDPHLHSHLLTFNMTYTADPSLYSVKALDPKRIFADSVHLDSIYKNDLAYGLRQLGHEVAIIEGSPEIPFVDKHARQLFSKAQRKIDQLEHQVFGTRRNPYHGVWVNDRFRRSKDGAKENQNILGERWRAEMSPDARAKLLDAIQRSISRSGQKATHAFDLPQAVCQARIEASKKTLFLSSKLIWKNLWPLIMGQLPWIELKTLIADAVTSVHPHSQPVSSILERLNLSQKAETFYPLLENRAPEPTKIAARSFSLTEDDHELICNQIRPTGYKTTI